MSKPSALTIGRKGEHLQLADQFRGMETGPCPHFDYEPLLSALPDKGQIYRRPMAFLGKRVCAPLWVSSMTGGTTEAREINRRLAQVCAEFGLGMGLGSCRIALEAMESKTPAEILKDFDLRPIVGDEWPLMGNIGIAQVERLLAQKKHHQLDQLVERLKLDGLFVHINPLQEWFQPEGDPITRPPIETLQELLEGVSFPVAIKEVGQGMGPASLKAALQLPLAAIEFAAFGGSNFTLLEMHRSGDTNLSPLGQVGHSAEDMVSQTNALCAELGSRAQCSEFIISGGVSSFLHGWSLIQSLVTTRTPTKNYGSSTVSAHNLGQIGMKRDRVTEVCSLHIARSRQEGDERRPPRWAVPEQDAEASSDGEAESQDGLKCEQFTKAVYGQAHALLVHARRDQASLRNYVRQQLTGLELAHRYLRATTPTQGKKHQRGRA